ncbi:MAG: UDP-N-acetylmuramoyl-tripeptide--D-alanyl-D-alanine ligase [Bacteroidetes bacterium]|nr:MAG: UDP-N-acetylmuramoyl-tripeptide--D-alanyl-D-alanine ligase [Bacteroidota bacterium]
MSTEQIYKEFLQSSGVCTDTRQVLEDSLFFALRGDQFDGNRFVEDALNKGCRLAITERKDLAGSGRVVVVSSTLEVLQQLAHYHRMQVAPRLIAITGSNGKTTTKELLAAVLSKEYTLLATRGNLNNHIGVPLTLLKLNREELALVEMGANHPGEIAELARIAAPEVGLITNVGKAHLEGFGSLQGVLDAKSELYAYLAKHGGTAIIDGRDQKLMRKADELGVACKVVAPKGDLPVAVNLISQTPFLDVELLLGEEVYPFSTKLVGAYNLQNILLAAATGVHFGVSGNAIAGAISGYLPDMQRSQMLEGGRNKLVLDSYNANPSSMREAIGGLLSYATSPTMLILGDMAELGDSSEKEHRELFHWISSLDVDQVLLLGPNFSQIYEPSNRITVFSGRKELEAYLGEVKPEGYHILLKGSRVMELERLVPLL